jgi:hypothetical protein
MELTAKEAAAVLKRPQWLVKRICLENGIGRVITASRLRLIPQSELMRIDRLAAERRKPGRPVSGQSSKNGTPKKTAKKAARRKSLSGKQKKNRRNA